MVELLTKNSLILSKSIKDAKTNKKVKAHVPRKMSPAQSKRIRKKPEMFSMMDHILDNIGECLGSRALAWCSGEISDMDLFEDIEIEAKLLGKTYDIPTQCV